MLDKEIYLFGKLVHETTGSLAEYPGGRLAMTRSYPDQRISDTVSVESL